jgi:hypothetical protein
MGDADWRELQQLTVVLRSNTSREKLKWQKSFPTTHDDKQATGTACIMELL